MDGELTDPRTVVREAKRLRAETAALFGELAAIEDRAHAAYARAVEPVVRAQLAAMPVSALQDATGGTVRVGAVESGGFPTVLSVRLATQERLEAIKGVGPKTSKQLIAAAAEIEEALRDSAKVRLDAEKRPRDHKKLIGCLAALGAARSAIEPIEAQLRVLANSIATDFDAARLKTSAIRRLFAGRRRKEEADEALHRLTQVVVDATQRGVSDRIASARRTLKTAAREPRDPWGDYETRAVFYNGVLADLAGGADTDAARGFLPTDLVDEINAVQLDQGLLDVSLRGYQEFGAKFAIAQVRTILGDEMGLGKTIQALAVLCHLQAQGYRHFLVVCPTSVLANWEHETLRHTRLDRIWRLHGPDRRARMKDWHDHGGLAITTFGTLHRIDVPDFDVAAIVIDEAHYVKNPDAKRTKALKRWLIKPSFTLLMSGTPMENRVSEFEALANLVRPDLASDIDMAAGVAGPDAFRKAVAPLYLRRNQEDVLDELPDKIETAEWVTLEGAALDAYRSAVAGENFMAMRRAAFMTPDPNDSPKLERLLEIVEEATANNRKVLVFSFFRDVLDRVTDELGGQVIGQINGSVPGPARQEMIERFTDHLEPCVLVSQIQAGGVGLNIQAASVVIITEPQWKPSTEEQAIARSHRLGQTRSVEVHRLLTEDSVDERMVEILAQKSALFADYARVSHLRDLTPEAVDVTDARSVDTVVSDAQNERNIITAEQHRLGL